MSVVPLHLGPDEEGAIEAIAGTMAPGDGVFLEKNVSIRPAKSIGVLKKLIPTPKVTIHP